MKKSTTLIIVWLSLLFIACSKKDKIDDNSLAGTSWKTEWSGTTDYLLISVTNKTAATLRAHTSEGDTEVEGTYVYSNPNISFRFEDGSTTLDMTGGIVDNIMYMSFDIDGHKYDEDFIKQ